MIKIQTTSGHKYCYDTNSNRISLWEESPTLQANPIIHYTPAQRSFDTSKITMFTIEMTQQCNLRCSYCCYSGIYRDRREHNEKEISWDMLKNTIDFIKQNVDSNIEQITVCFYGGEALLAKDKLYWAVDVLLDAFGNKIVFSLSTNGLALKPEIVDWICSIPNFFVNITIDGNKEMHDKCRKTLNGKGTFDIISGNLIAFQNKFPKEYISRVRFLSTVDSWNSVKSLSDVWSTERILRDTRPMRVSHLIPNFGDLSRKYDTKADKDKFYDYAFRQYKKGYNNIAVDLFKRLIGIVGHRQFYTLPSNQTILTCFHEMYACFVNVDGNLYACEKFCGEHKIGNVDTGFDRGSMDKLYFAFVERKDKFCSSCWASRLCRMCLTSLNFTEEEMSYLCQMEKDTLELALKYYCEVKEFESINKKKMIFKN